MASFQKKTKISVMDLKPNQLSYQTTATNEVDLNLEIGPKDTATINDKIYLISQGCPPPLRPMF